MMRGDLFPTLFIALALFVAGPAMAADSTIKKPVAPASPSIQGKPAPAAPHAATTPTAPSSPSAPEIGAISRSTGHLFREGLASGIAADRALKKNSAIKSNDKGLLTTSADGSLGDQIWGKMSAGDLTDRLSLLAPNPDFPLTRDLGRRLLLTDSPWPEGDALRALRLQKMMTFETDQQAAQLYTSWSLDNPSLVLLQMGASALMRAGQPSVACLDITVHQDLWKPYEQDQPIFPALMTHCKKWMKSDAQAGAALRAPAPDGPYDPRDEMDAAMSPSHPLARAASLYAQAKSGAIDSAFLSSFATHIDKMPVQTQILFAPFFEKISPQMTGSVPEIMAVADVLFLAGSPKAVLWAQRLQAQLPTPAVHNLHASALILLGKMQDPATFTGVIPTKFQTLKDEKKSRAAKFLKILSELLDKRPDFIDTPVVVYEKKSGLTNASRYVMHWGALQDDLRDAQKNGQIGQFVLASLLALQADKPADIGSDVVVTISKGMETMGLKEEARQLVATVLLGVIKTGE